MDAENLQQLINTRRKELGKTVKGVAQDAGIYRDTLNKILKNPKRIPELPTLAGLAIALDIPLGRVIRACGYDLDQPRPTE